MTTDLRALHDAPIWQAIAARTRVTENGCWACGLSLSSPGRRASGRYPRLNFRGRHQYAHRVAWELFVGPLRPADRLMRKLSVCDHSTCINPAHWRKTTCAGVVRQRAKDGRASSGAKHAIAVMLGRRRAGTQKLDLEKARAIRASAEPASVEAAKYGIDESMVRYIRAGRAWREPTPFSW